MAEKMSTLILTVDLECCRCYKKIRKVIAKFPEIQRQIFDEKNNKVIVSGPFDPEKLKRKLCCKACKYIKDIQIKPPEKPKPPEQPKPAPPPKPVEQLKPAPPPPKPAPPPPEPAPPPPKPAPPPPEPAPPPPKPVDPPPEPVPCPPKQAPPSPMQDPPPPPPPPKPAPPPPEPVGPYTPMVCCRPCYEGYPEHGICTRFGYESGTCNYTFFSEEDPSCAIM